MPVQMESSSPIARIPYIAVRCGWCQDWASPEDEEKHEHGALISHGICTSCATQWEAQIA